MIAEGRRGDAVRHFMNLVGMPAVMVHAMRFFPGWRKLKAVFHTLPNDLAIVYEHQKGKLLPRGRSVVWHIIGSRQGRDAFERNVLGSIYWMLCRQVWRSVDDQLRKQNGGLVWPLK